MPLRQPLPAASTHPTLGIDVSSNQGTIDWARVGAARVRNPVTRQLGPVSFAFVRSATGGASGDSRFLEYWRGAKAAGVRVGPYVAMTVRAHELGAQHYVDQLSRLLDAGGYGAGDLEPMLDHERGNPETNPEPTPEVWRRNVATLLNVRDLIARRLGRRCGVYAGGYWTSCPADVQDALAGSPLWSPDYRAIDGAPWDVRAPVGWARWHFRQFTNGQNGTVVQIPGVATRCDVDLYDGSPLALRLHVARSHLTASKAVGAALGLGLLVLLLAMAWSRQPLVLGAWT